MFVLFFRMKRNGQISIDNSVFESRLGVRKFLKKVAAKKNGKYLGRRTVIDKKLISQVQDLKETKNLSITEISKITGRARNTIYKVLKEELNYIPYNQLVKNINKDKE